ncbi:MAG: pilin [Microgenomates group bacterium]
MKALKKVSDCLNKALLAGVVYAALPPREITIAPPEGWEKLGQITLPGIISTLIKLILIVAALIAFIFLVVGGIKWITSGGDKETTAKAQSTITAALIGLVIVFAAWAIIRLLEVFFGFEILTSLKIPQVP